MVVFDQPGRPDFVKVLDFGISRSLETSGAGTKGALGTPRYMAPEQWRGRRVGPAADLYAVGCVMYLLLTARPIFWRTTGPELMDRHVRDTYTPVEELANDVPEAMLSLVDALLEKDPARRPASAALVIEALHRIEASEGLGDLLADRTSPDSEAEPVETVLPEEKVPPPPRVRTPAARRPPLRKSPIALGAAVAVLAVGGGLAVRAARTHGARVNPRLARVELTSEPTGATVHWGERVLCATPCDVLLPAQSDVANLRIEAAGRKTTPLPPHLDGGSTVRRHVVLEPR